MPRGRSSAWSASERPLHGKLRGGIHAECLGGTVPRNGREVDDVPGTARSHAGQEGASDIQQAEHIRAIQTLDFVSTALLDCAKQGNAGVVYQHINVSKVSEGTAFGGFHLRLVRHIENRGEQVVTRAKVFQSLHRACTGNQLFPGCQHSLGDLRAETTRGSGNPTKHGLSCHPRVGLKHLAHPAFADQGGHVVMGDAGADGQGHELRAAFTGSHPPFLPRERWRAYSACCRGCPHGRQTHRCWPAAA